MQVSRSILPISQVSKRPVPSNPPSLTVSNAVVLAVPLPINLLRVYMPMVIRWSLPLSGNRNISILQLSDR